MTTLFDVDYTGPRHTYAFTHRPFAYAHQPGGFIVGSLRPHPTYPHGTIQYPHPLSAEDIDRYELDPLGDADPYRAEAASLWPDLLMTNHEFAVILLRHQWIFRPESAEYGAALAGDILPAYDSFAGYRARVRAVEELRAYRDEAREVAGQ